MLRLFLQAVLKLLGIDTALSVSKAYCAWVSTLGGSCKVSQQNNTEHTEDTTVGPLQGDTFRERDSKMYGEWKQRDGP